MYLGDFETMEEDNGQGSLQLLIRALLGDDGG